MPGKVNPVIPEVVNQVAFEVIGNDLTVAFAAEGGQLQLNTFEPVIAFNILESTRIMTRAMNTLADRCIAGVTVNEDVLEDHLRRSIGVVTALVPVIGYAAATDVAATALDTGRPVAELVLERGLLDEARLNSLLSPGLNDPPAPCHPHRQPAGGLPDLAGLRGDRPPARRAAHRGLIPLPPSHRGPTPPLSPSGATRRPRAPVPSIDGSCRCSGSACSVERGRGRGVPRGAGAVFAGAETRGGAQAEGASAHPSGAGRGSLSSLVGLFHLASHDELRIRGAHDLVILAVVLELRGSSASR